MSAGFQRISETNKSLRKQNKNLITKSKLEKINSIILAAFVNKIKFNNFVHVKLKKKCC